MKNRKPRPFSAVGLLPLWLRSPRLPRYARCAAAALFLLEATVLPARETRSASDQQVEVDGVSWAYSRSGRGEPLLLLHGFGASRESWGPILPYLTAEYDVVAVDLPGFGESGKPDAARYDVRSQAERLRRFAETIGLTSFHLIGNSMGGSIAGEFAAAHPENVRSLTLIAAAGVRGAKASAFDRHFAAGGDNVMIPTNLEEFDRQMEWLFHEPPTIPASIKEEIVDRIARNAAFAAKAHADLIADWPALEQTLEGFAKPTLIIWGAEDRLVQASAARLLHERLPRSRLEILSNCGHVPMMERPHKVARLIASFTSRL